MTDGGKPDQVRQKHMGTAAEKAGAPPNPWCASPHRMFPAASFEARQTWESTYNLEWADASRKGTRWTTTGSSSRHPVARGQ